jgi:hypothetical protein
MWSAQSITEYAPCLVLNETLVGNIGVDYFIVQRRIQISMVGQHMGSWCRLKENSNCLSKRKIMSRLN